MTQRLPPRTLVFLLLPPLLWAGNAVVGRLVSPLVPPMLLNFLRWALAFVLLLPLAGRVLTPGSLLWPHWRRFSVLGLLSVGVYNALQYLALKTSTPMNVTLVAASMPIWMLGIGWLCFKEKVSRRQLLGAVLSICGVLLVLSRGDWQVLMRVQLVPGDLYVLLAVVCWAFYSWMLARPQEPPQLRADWAAFLMGQIAFGLAWSAAFAAGEWALGSQPVVWGWPLIAALAFVAVGPAVIAYRCWGAGVAAAGPTLAGFFANLTPLFAALMSLAFLGETPRLYHALSFVLIVGGIVVCSRR
jgi:drug/metabolite transporter (DMT)-like permease